MPAPSRSYSLNLVCAVDRMDRLMGNWPFLEGRLPKRMCGKSRSLSSLSELILRGRHRGGIEKPGMKFVRWCYLWTYDLMGESDKQASISLRQPNSPETASSPSAYPSSWLHTPDIGCISFMAQAFFSYFETLMEIITAPAYRSTFSALFPARGNRMERWRLAYLPSAPHILWEWQHHLTHFIPDFPKPP